MTLVRVTLPEVVWCKEIWHTIANTRKYSSGVSSLGQPFALSWPDAMSCFFRWAKGPRPHLHNAVMQQCAILKTGVLTTLQFWSNGRYLLHPTCSNCECECWPLIVGWLSDLPAIELVTSLLTRLAPSRKCFQPLIAMLLYSSDSIPRTHLPQPLFARVIKVPN